MPNITEILRNATEVLQKSGIAESRREANSLLAFTLKKEKTFLIAHNDYQLSDEEEINFQSVLERRAGREPFQYITGKQEFYGLDFLLTPDVLIPRPETELIVENAIEILKMQEKPTFCEVGVGSGCISVSILHEIQTASAIGLDISANALEITKLNAERHKVLERLKLKLSDVFGILSNEHFNLIVSNPPYIPIGDIKNLQAEVRRFEPLNALTDGQNGLSIIEKIITETPKFLKPGGILLMEIGFDQSDRVKRMFDAKIWQSAEFLPDLQNIQRMVKAKKLNL
ncbi:MAG: peptide chain release factor N(5)-glutamine methyltransferase [Actinomycetota bacterium]